MNEYRLSAKTVTDILVLVHSVLTYSAKICPTVSPVEIQYPQKRTKEMRVLSRSEQTVLTEYLLTDLDPCKFGVLLALWTGMRIGEVCALQWDHLILEERLIKVEATMQRLHNSDPLAPFKTYIVLDLPKTVSSIRSIPMGKQITDICQRMNPDNSKAYILTGAERYMEPRLLQYHFQRYAADCGLAGVSFHTLRHTFATRCIEVGFDIKSLSEILGHANTSITLNRYIHCSMELKRENMRKLDSIGI